MEFDQPVRELRDEEAHQEGVLRVLDLNILYDICVILQYYI